VTGDDDAIADAEFVDQRAHVEVGIVGAYEGVVKVEFIAQCCQHSQHLFDPYSITHVSHGLIFYGVLWLVARRMKMGWRFCIAIAIAAAWEILENSPFIINRYRNVTMSLEYLGDSVINALGDVASCGIGFVLARWMGWRWALALFVATEVLLLVLIKDNLTLNVIMLVWPLQAIKDWQMVGHAPG